MLERRRRALKKSEPPILVALRMKKNMKTCLSVMCDNMSSCMHGIKGWVFFFILKHLLQRLPFTWQFPGQSLSPCKLLECLHIHTSASDSMCSAEYEKAPSIGACKPVLRASLLCPPPITSFLFLTLCGEAVHDGIPQSPTFTTFPLWFWVGTGLGNWSLWALRHIQQWVEQNHH